MSGICGIVFPDAYQAAPRLTPLLEALEPRGGPVSHQHSYKNANIGCCGSPLLSNRKKNLWCIFDGTLFNQERLIQRLKEAGRCIPPNFVPEDLLLLAYDVWSYEFLQEIEGDFAVAILDQEKNEILLARDRIGRKPLYWYHKGYTFVFASELKALMASRLIPQTPSDNAIASYLFFGFIPQDNTPIAEVTRLLPGHYLKLHLNHNMSIHNYWAYSSYFQGSIEQVEYDTPQELAQRVSVSLEKRIQKNNNSTSCLVSGGLGSASVAYFLSTQQPTKAFSAAFQGQTEQDSQTATQICSTLQIEQQFSLIGPDKLLTTLPKILWHLDEPLADPNIVLTWHLAEMAAKWSPYTVSGMGSDELFAAHNRFLVTEQSLSPFMQLTEWFKPIFRTLFLQPLFWLWPKMGYEFLRKYPTNPLQAQYVNSNALLNIHTAKKAAPAIAHLFDLDIFLHRFYNISKAGTNMDAMLYLDVKTRLVDLYIMQYDRLTACHKLHWTSPFLSKDLLEFAAPLIRGGLQKETESSLLQLMLANIFSPAIVNRKKTSRPNLLNQWVEHPQLFSVFSALKNGTLTKSGMINRLWIESLLAKNNKTPNRFLSLWSILCLEIWYRIYIDQPIQTTPPSLSTQEFIQET